MVAEFIQLTVSGVLIASLLALGAVGLSLTFGVARFANVAHPDFMMLGAYGVFAFNALVGVPFVWAAPLGVLVAIVIGVPVARFAFDKLPVSGTVQLLIISIGVSLVLFAISCCLHSARVSCSTRFRCSARSCWGPVRLTAFQILTLAVTAVLVFAGAFTANPYAARADLARVVRRPGAVRNHRR